MGKNRYSSWLPGIHWPTNYATSISRTINRELGLTPYSNQDFLTPILRDVLMPVRKAVVNCWPLGRCAQPPGCALPYPHAASPPYRGASHSAHTQS